MNDNLILISGKSATGKSVSLRNIKSPEGVCYLNCENNKKLPFKSKFKEFAITDPKEINNFFDQAEKEDSIHTIIVDSLTYMMDMYESVHVIPATNTMHAWGGYAQFFKKLMSQHVAKSSKNIIFIGLTSDIFNEDEMVKETVIKVKGSLMNNGIESAFSTVISSKKISTKQLEQYNSPLLNITDEEMNLGFKYCFQTRLTKETIGDRIRSSIGMWAINETYIDNDVQLVIDRLHKYYG